MGVDDQLFKEDGTWITRIDNMLLRVAALVATPLVHEEDETYDRALRTLLRISSIMYVIASTFTFSINSILGLVVAIVFFGGPWIVSVVEKCNGRGSTIDRGDKVGALATLVFTLFITIFLPLTVMTAGYGSMASAVAWFFASTIVFLFVMFYIARLGAPTPKRKKAHSRSFAWHH